MVEKMTHSLGSDPLHVGDEFFGGKDALYSWVGKNLPSNKFELFLDVISLIKIITDNNKEFEDVMKMMEYTYKGKCSSTAVAKYLPSILLEIPTVLGSAKTYDEGVPLPGVKT